MSFSLFEAAVSSEQEAGIAKQAATDKLEAAIYDVRSALGPFLFQARSIEEFRDRVAMTKNDNSLYRLIEPHIHPAAGIVRRVAGRNGQLEKEFKAILATGLSSNPDLGEEYNSTLNPAPTGGPKNIGDIMSNPGAEAVSGPASGSGLSPVTQSTPSGGRANTTYEPGTVARRRQACYPGCEKNEAHAKKFHGKESRRQADFDGTMDIKNTFKPSDGELIPKDDWDGYRNKVDQNSSKVDRNFTSSMEFRVYADWAEANQAHPMRLATLDAYAGNLSDAAYMRLARAIQAWEFEHKPKAPKGQSKSKLKDVTATYDPNDEYDNAAQDEMFRRHQERGGEGNPDPREFWDEPKPSHHWQNDPKTHSYANRRQSGPSAYGGPDDYMGQATGNEGYVDGPIDPVTSFGGGPGGYPAHHPHHLDPAEANRMMEQGEDTFSHHGGRDPLKQYIAWCTKNNLKRISARNVDHYSRGNPRLAVHLATRIKTAIHTARQRQAADHAVDEWNRFDRPLTNPYTGDDGGQFKGNPEGHGHWAPEGGPHPSHQARRRQAAPDYLQKADDALTQLLNQKAEEFQNTIAPLQQALVTVQQAVQLTQQANPLNVLPPPGTVNVMPGQAAPGQVGQPDPSAGQDPAAAAAAALAPAQAAGQLPGGDPSAGAPPPDGGQGAPPPAAADQGGLPPDPSQQMQARRRGGQGKGRGANRPRQANSVFDLWNKWQGNNTGVGGDADYENFANQFGVGSQALNKLKTHHQQALVAGRHSKPPTHMVPMDDVEFQSFPDHMDNRFDGGTHETYAEDTGKVAAETKTPNIAEEGVKAQWRMMDAQMSQAGYKFDKGSQHWMKAGQKPIKNPWPHSAGKHDYRHGDDDQIFYPQRGHEGWGHESGPSGPPYVRDQPTESPHRHEASRKQAWMGWGPSQFPKTRKVAGWDWVENQNGYAAKSPRRFECSCGTDFPTPTGFHRCACGKSWNSYVIGTGGSNREASTDSFWVREIPTRPDVIVAANQRMEAGQPPAGWSMTQPPGDILNTWRDSPTPGNFDDTQRKHRELYEQQGKHPYDSAPVDAIHTLMDPRTGQLHDLVDPGELGEGKDPGHPKPKKTTKDWHHRDKNQRWTGK